MTRHEAALQRNVYVRTPNTKSYWDTYLDAYQAPNVSLDVDDPIFWGSSHKARLNQKSRRALSAPLAEKEHR